MHFITSLFKSAFEACSEKSYIKLKNKKLRNTSSQIQNRTEAIIVYFYRCSNCSRAANFNQSSLIFRLKLLNIFYNPRLENENWIFQPNSFPMRSLFYKMTQWEWKFPIIWPGFLLIVRGNLFKSLIIFWLYCLIFNDK